MFRACVIATFAATGAFGQAFKADDAFADLGVYESEDACKSRDPNNMPDGARLVDFRYSGEFDMCKEEEYAFCFPGTGISGSPDRAVSLKLLKNTGNVEVKVFDGKANCEGTTIYAVKVEGDSIDKLLAGECVFIDAGIKKIYVLKEAGKDIKCLADRRKKLLEEESGGADVGGDESTGLVGDSDGARAAGMLAPVFLAIFATFAAAVVEL